MPNRIEEQRQDPVIPLPPEWETSMGLAQAVDTFRALLDDHAGAGLRYAETLLAAAERNNSLATWIQAKGLCAEACYYLGRFKDMMRIIDEIVPCENRLTTAFEFCLYHSIVGTALIISDRRSESVSHLYKAMLIGEGRDDCAKFYWQTLFCLGNFYLDEGCYSAALDIMLQARQLPEYHKAGRDGASPLDTNLGLAYMRIGDPKKARHYFERRLRFCRTTGNIAGTGESLLGIAMLLIEEHGDAAEALELSQQALTLLRGSACRYWEGVAYQQTARALLLLERYDEALAYCRQALDDVNFREVPTLQFDLLCQQAAIYTTLSDWNNARAACERAHELEQDIDRPELTLCLFPYLIEVCEAQDDPRGALMYQKQLAAVRRRLLGAEEQRRIAKVEMQEAQRRARRATEHLKLQLRDTRRRSQEHEQEISKLLLQVTQRDEALRKLRAQISSYRRRASKSDKKFVADLLASLMLSIGSEEASALLESDLLRAFASTVRELRRHSPALTATELKICLLLRLDLSTKEIAAILFKSTETLRTQRRSIRRKLNLTTENNLVSFLLSL